MRVYLAALVHDPFYMRVDLIGLFVVFIIVAIRKRTGVGAHEVVELLLLGCVILLLLRLQTHAWTLSTITALLLLTKLKPWEKTNTEPNQPLLSLHTHASRRVCMALSTAMQPQQSAVGPKISVSATGGSGGVTGLIGMRLKVQQYDSNIVLVG